jgi:hypothetical protein
MSGYESDGAGGYFSVWFGVTNEGVVRVKLNDVDKRKRGDAVTRCACK